MPTAANAARGTRMLYLDDSGAISPKHSSGAVVIGGLSVSSTKVPRLTRRISGAKARHFPERGRPSQWELKSTDLLTPKAWRNRRNQALVLEVVRILGGLDCTVYTASIDKARMHHSMATKASMPMQLHRLVEHFAAARRAPQRDRRGRHGPLRAPPRRPREPLRRELRNLQGPAAAPRSPLRRFHDLRADPGRGPDLSGAAPHHRRHPRHARPQHPTRGPASQRPHREAHTHTHRPWTNQIVVI